ncbi:hypothetical protein VTL71DRAFT_8833 [Oculimacula yallundae]|uniref:Uncharacterized protein n=1 Tax=Oculimacula yallundae TaxID=86028 RepID=A0ABR4D0A6_9HELO
MAPPNDWRPLSYWDQGPDVGTKPLSNEGWMKVFDSADKYGFRGAYHPRNQFPGSPWTPTWRPTKEEFVGKLEPLVHKVLADWNTLKKIVERHGETLEKRWMKKTKKKQRDLLLTAWPNMAPAHRPDFEAFRQENTGKYLVGLTKFPESYLWPDINLQDLSSKSLVIFINSRGRNPPSTFARTDINSTHLATVSHSVEEPAFLLGYNLFMDGETADTYGRLASWNDDIDTVHLMFSQRQFTPGDGLRVLQIQDRIYPFLIKCCELILHDLAGAGSLLDPNFPTTLQTTTAADPAPTGVNEILPTLATISAEAPYRIPANLDLERIRGILAARRSAAEDHLFALREDPGYFADTIRDWSDHRNDALLDTEGNPHPTGPHTIDFWERVIRNEKYKDEISYDKQLPEEYLVALLHFREILKVSAENPMHYLKNIQSSPPLRHYFTREPQRPGTINMLIRPKSYSDAFFHKPWGLLLMLWDEKQRELIGFTNLIDAFEQLFQDPDIKKYLSPYIEDLFGDLGIFSRILHELELYQPWGATFDDEHEASLHCLYI